MMPTINMALPATRDGSGQESKTQKLQSIAAVADNSTWRSANWNLQMFRNPCIKLGKSSKLRWRNFEVQLLHQEEVLLYPFEDTEKGT